MTRLPRILLVEDDPASLELMAYLLGKAGYPIERATNGREALDAIRRARPDLVVMDVQMPQLDGLAAVRSLRADARTRDLVVVAVTAVAMVGDKEKVLAAGFDGYLAKPIVPETFVAQVEEFIDETSRSGFVAPRLTRGPATPPRAASDRDSEAADPLVLVVDDSRENLALLRDVLEPSGYRVNIARSAADALVAVLDVRPGLIVTDFHMPEIDGLAFVRALRADPRLGEIPVVVMSSSLLDQEELRRVKAEGVDDIIMRPIDPVSLVARLRVLLPGRPVVDGIGGVP